MKITPVLLFLSALAASAFAGAYSDKVLSDAPFAYYRLDEPSNTGVAADQVGNNPGTFVNTPTSGVAGALPSDPASTAFSFKSSSSQYVQLTTMGNYGSSQPSGYTVEYWLKTSDKTSFQNVLGVNNSSTNQAFLIDLNYFGVAGRVRLYDRDPNNNRFESNFYTSTAGNIDVFDGAWHHLVHVYEPAAGTADRIRLYVDSVRQVNNYLPAGTAPVNVNYQLPMALAAVNNRGAVQNYLNGSLDEVAFYKTVLSDATIGGHFAAGVQTPPAITGPTLAGVTSSGATLGGNVTSDGRSAITERGVLMAKSLLNADPKLGGMNVTQATASGTTGVFTAPVTGLEEQTQYSYCAYATNALGTTYTAVATFTTPRLIFLPTITGPTLANITSAGATVGGNVTDDGRTTITERGVLVAQTSLDANPKLGDMNIVQVTAAGTTGVFTAPVAGLNEETQYTYCAYATNAAGTAYTAVATFTTPRLIFAPAITGPTLANVFPGSATLGGNVTDDGRTAITERGVLIAQTSLEADPKLGDQDVVQMTVAGTTGVFTAGVGNLVEETSYSYCAYAINAAGTTYTAIASFTTPRLIFLPTVTGPTLTGLTDASATLGGNVTDDGRTAITARGVLIVKTALNADPRLGGTGVTKLTASGTTGIFTAPATALVQETAYSYRAFATNAAGTAYTAVATFTTPTHIDFHAVDDRAVTTGGATRIYPLANDVAPSGAPLSLLRVSDAAITIDDRSLLIPAGFTGNFTYLCTDGTLVGDAMVTVTAGVPAVKPLNFSGLLREADGTIGGSADLTFTTSGRVASLRLLAGTATLRTYVILPAGAVSVTRATVLGTITVTRNANRTVSFQLQPAGGNLTGTLSPRSAPAAAAARYHVALASIDAAIPGGGYAVVTVAKTGLAMCNVLLPDGHSFIAGTSLRDDGTLAFYSLVTSGVNPAAAAAGELVVADLAATDVTGEVAWTKTPQRVFVRGLHLGGVDTVLTANGSLFRGEVPPSGAGTLELSGGNLTPTGPQTVTVTRGRPALPAGLVQSWTVLGNASFSASLKVPGRTHPVTATGLYLPKSRRAWGFFLGTDVGGRLELTVLAVQ